jgi:cytoskeletal protein RodZ
MQTIGEKIEETRKRKGISLSEAAEATKIRRDFLLNIESNQYDYDLPEIYKRGFIKNYAKYLKLNADKVLSQYQEQQITQSRRSKKVNSDLFGTNTDLAQTSTPDTLDPLLEKPSLGKINLNKPSEPKDETPVNEEGLSNKDLYIKTAIVGISTLLFVFGIIWLIQTVSQSMNSNNDPIANSGSTTSATSVIQTNEVKQTAEYPIKEITLKASGTVYIQIRQKIDNKVLLAKQLIEGEIQTIKRRGPVDVAFTKGNFITLITGDEGAPIQPNTKGTGKITLP